MFSSQEKIKFLKNVFLFKEISEQSLYTLADYVKEKSYKKSEIIFNEGEEGNNLYIIISGKVKIIKSDKNGKEKIIAILKEKDSFGEMALLTREQRSATVQALTDVETLIINAIDFENLIKKEPTIPLNIIKTLSERLARTDRQLKHLAFGSAEEKVANVLLDIIETDKIEISHQEIANLAGLTRETTTRILDKFKKEKVIAMKRKNISIRNKEKLKKFIL